MGDPDVGGKRLRGWAGRTATASDVQHVSRIVCSGGRGEHLFAAFTQMECSLSIEVICFLMMTIMKRSSEASHRQFLNLAN